MCYSTALRKKRQELEDKLFKEALKLPEMELPLEFEPYYHRNGFTHQNLFIIPMEDTQRIVPASWGLVPHWAEHKIEEFRKKSNTLNCKSETMFEKASFRDSAHDQRCLILADGFFEPHHENGQAIPYFCFQPSSDYPEGNLFVFGGLYTEFEPEDAPDESQFTCTIITMPANAFFAEVHNKRQRMPLVLDPEFIEDWMDDGLNDSSVHELIADGFSRKPFAAHPVSRDFYKKGIDTNKPYIVEEVEKDTLF